MQKSKLLQHVAALDRKEHRRWHQYVLRSTDSVYLHTLSQILLDQRPRWDSSRLTEEQIYPLIYPDAPPSVNRLRKLMTKLLQSLEDFWIIQTALNDPIYRSKALRKNYLQKELYHIYETASHKRVKELQEREANGLIELQELFEIHEEWAYEYQNLTHIDLDTTRDITLDYLAQTQTIQSLKYLNVYNLANRSVTIETPEYLKAIHHNIDNLKNIWPDHPELKCYFLVHRLNENPLYVHKKEAFEFTKDRSSKISKESLYDCLQIIIRANLSPKTDDEKQLLLQIVEWGIASKSIYRHGKADFTALHNLILQLSTSGELAYAETLNEATFKAINASGQSNIYYFNKGYIRFSDKNYLASIDALNKIGKINIPTLEVAKRTLELYIYFYLSPQDPGYYELIASSIDNFYKYIKRHKYISASRKESELEKINILRQLYANSTDIKPYIYKRLHDQILKNTILTKNGRSNLISILEYLKQEEY